MSSRPLTATLPPPGTPIYSGEPFAHEFASLVQDIQRTRDWFNSQLDAQLASLHKLCAATPKEEPKCALPMATLFEAPHPVPAPPPQPAAVAETPVVKSKVASVNQAIILPPTQTAMLDPELEQATLHELNNALTRAFSEISARGGMLADMTQG